LHLASRAKQFHLVTVAGSNGIESLLSGASEQHIEHVAGESGGDSDPYTVLLHLVDNLRRARQELVVVAALQEVDLSRNKHREHLVHVRLRRLPAKLGGKALAN